ncbi:MAG: TRAP transporter small permease subunit [Alphaproteobacteria bacterium]|nr:TRAP transporter small permease subunit [Alphaproteobacteria bacterium]
MRKLLEIADVCEWFPQKAGKLGAWLIVPLIIVIMYDITTRKLQFIQQAVLNSPLYEYISPTKLQEWEWHLHTALFLLALGYAYVNNAHVRVDLIREKCKDRTQAWIEFFGIILALFPYCIVIGIISMRFIELAYTSNEISQSMTGLSQRWIIKSFLLIGLFLALLAGISTLLRHIVYLFGPAHLRDDVPMNMLTSAESAHLPRIEDEDLNREDDDPIVTSS